MYREADRIYIIPAIKGAESIGNNGHTIQRQQRRR